MRRKMNGTVVGLLLVTVSAWADGLTVIQGSEGTSGTVMDLGNGLGVYSDSHGNSGSIVDLGGGLRTFQFTSPSGEMKSGTIQSFGSVPEPIRPAPVLPFGPHVSPLMTPGEPKAPSVAPPSSGSLGTGFWRR